MPINSQIMKVLIIEQEKTLQQSLSYYREHHRNFEVLLANSKKEGISLLEKPPAVWYKEYLRLNGQKLL